jgi:hypothetical protein
VVGGAVARGAGVVCADLTQLHVAQLHTEINAGAAAGTESSHIDVTAVQGWHAGCSAACTTRITWKSPTEHAAAATAAAADACGTHAN